MLAICGATVHTATAAGTIQGATILIKEGKILAVGQHLAVPHQADMIQADGKIITPGFIDCHTHIGLAEEATGSAHLDKNEVNDVCCPHLRAIDGIDPEDAALRDAYSAGITAIIVTPGSETVIGGQSVAIKTYGKVIDHMILRQPAGIKMAFGENPIKTYISKNKPPSTRMSIAGIIREALVDAQNYQKIKASSGRDLRMEALCLLLDGHIPLRAHAHAADDIMTAIRIADEFGLKLNIEHATAAHKIAHELAVRNVSAAIGPSITARVKVELQERTYSTPALLHQAGVKIALITDHPILPVSSLRLEAALAIRQGLPSDVALQAITLSAAQIAGISDRVGSLEQGKDADLVIFDSHPFDVAAKIERVFINGKQISGQ